MIIRVLSLCLVAFICTNCTNKQQAPTTPVKTYPEIFNKVLEAHGGKATWDAMNTLTYTIGTGAKAEEHTVELKSRRSLIEVPGKYKLGFDGKDVWISPHRDSFSGQSPRFMHNLRFYFVAIPFVFTDPGVNIKDGGMVTTNGKEYHLVHVTFEDHIGDAPEDHYNMYVDPNSNRIDFITYSVTYFDTSRATKYNALRYDWAEANGLLAPTMFTGYKWEQDSLGEQRYQSSFSKLRYDASFKADQTYSVPEGAYIDQPEQ